MAKAFSAPLTLWVYVFLSTVDTVVRVLRGSIHPTPAIFAIVVILIWNAALLYGFRWVWIGTLLLFVVFFVIGLYIEGIDWFGDLVTLMVIGLLLLPSTRRFFGSAEVAKSSY
ncbi:MAG: hypothetical protein JSU06_13080 [Actinobacteria bacterium]|nr:hypothetical protein [Actinomycetota bacterium]